MCGKSQSTTVNIFSFLKLFLLLTALPLLLVSCGGGGNSDNSVSDSDIDSVSFEMLDTTNLESISLPETPAIPAEEEPEEQILEEDDDNVLGRLVYSNGTSITGRQIGNLLETTISNPETEDLVVLNDEFGRGVLVTTESGAQAQYYYDEAKLKGLKLRDISGQEYLFTFNEGKFKEVENLPISFNSKLNSIAELQQRNAKNSQCLTAQSRDYCALLLGGLGIGGYFVACTPPSPLCLFVVAVTAGHLYNCYYVNNQCETPPVENSPEDDLPPNSGGVLCRDIDGVTTCSSCPTCPPGLTSCNSEQKPNVLLTVQENGGDIKSFYSAQSIALNKSYEVAYQTGPNPGLFEHVTKTINVVFYSKPGTTWDMYWSVNGTAEAHHILGDNIFPPHRHVFAVLDKSATQEAHKRIASATASDDVFRGYRTDVTDPYDDSSTKSGTDTSEYQCSQAYKARYSVAFELVAGRNHGWGSSNIDANFVFNGNATNNR